MVLRLGVRALACVALSGSAAAHAAPELSRLVDAGVSRYADARDSLITAFDARELPLIMASLSESPPTDVDPALLYRAMTRWHYFASTKFDPKQTGIWRTGESHASSADHPFPSLTLSTGAALELVELTALARMAQERGHVFDPLVWWNDHRELQRRLGNLLYDPVGGAYANLDSLGRRLPTPAISGLIPIALGAFHGSETTRLAAWRLWTGSEQRMEQGNLNTALATRQHADAFEEWNRDHGLHVAPTETMAAWSLQALHDLDEPTLAVYVRDALVARGLPAERTFTVQIGNDQRPMSAEWFAVRPLERSRAALRFLEAVGVFPEEQADSLRSAVDLAEDAGDSLTGTAIAVLTDLVVELRAINPRDASSQWSLRRSGNNDLDSAKDAAFDFQWSDLRIWYARALDLITADILKWHLRSDYHSSWTATLNPGVIGQGDQARLQVRCRDSEGLANFQPGTVTLMWTDGSRLMPPADFPLTQTGERSFESATPRLPGTNGLWHLIVEGLPDRPRMSPAISVVEPVVVSIVPSGRHGTTVDWAVQLRSQVRAVVNGRVDLEAPLSWTSAPGTSLNFELPPGGVTEVHFSVTPDFDVVPGSYPLHWTAWSKSRLIGEYETRVHHPLAWLRIGPLPITDPANPIDSHYGFDQQIDLAQRVQGIDRQIAWTRLPQGRVDADGFIHLEGKTARAGLHYAFTGFVTQSEDAILEFESDGPARVFVNGTRVINLERWGGRREADVRFGPGTNFLVVKLADPEGTGARFRLQLRDIDGQVLRGVGNELEHLLENYAYLARAERDEQGSGELHTLRLVPIRFADPLARSVSVVGSFNGWSPDSTPMSRTGDGAWQVKIRLRPGRFEYKFAVDGAEWIPDPNNPDAVADGFGGRNSVLVVD